MNSSQLRNFFNFNKKYEKEESFEEKVASLKNKIRLCKISENYSGLKSASENLSVLYHENGMFKNAFFHAFESCKASFSALKLFRVIHNSTPNELVNEMEKLYRNAAQYQKQAKKNSSPDKILVEGSLHLIEFEKFTTAAKLLESLLDEEEMQPVTKSLVLYLIIYCQINNCEWNEAIEYIDQLWMIGMRHKNDNSCFNFIVRDTELMILVIMCHKYPLELSKRHKDMKESIKHENSRDFYSSISQRTKIWKFTQLIHQNRHLEAEELLVTEDDAPSSFIADPTLEISVSRMHCYSLVSYELAKNILQRKTNK